MFPILLYTLVALVVVLMLFLLSIEFGDQIFTFAISWKNAKSFRAKLFWRLFIRRDRKLDKLLVEIMDICRSRGFPIMSLAIWRVRWTIMTNKAGLISHNDYKGDIFIFSFNTFTHTQDQLRILIAHEVGHHVDNITLGTSHPFTDRIRKLNLNCEEFAWFVAAYLYSRDAIMKYLQYGSDFKPDKLKNVEICNQHLANDGVE